jgi:hypothetical protein
MSVVVENKEKSQIGKWAKQVLVVGFEAVEPMFLFYFRKIKIFYYKFF